MSSEDSGFTVQTPSPNLVEIITSVEASAVVLKGPKGGMSESMGLFPISRWV